MEALRVDHPGSSSTIQDRGRPGYRGFGVPIGGAFDRRSHDLSNALVGNDPEAASLELTLWGGIYSGLIPLALALAGTRMEGVIRSLDGSTDRRLMIPQSFTLQAGEQLILRAAPAGIRTYLAVRGGWQTPTVLGSRSTETRLVAEQILQAEPGTIASVRPVQAGWITPDDQAIRVLDGPDGDARILESTSYRVTNRSDRMGLMLEGPTIDRQAEADRPSSPVAPGAIQVTNGQPIILGIAGGTMGGYLHLAHVISADLDRLAQARPGQVLTFQRVEIEEARLVDRLDRQAQHARLTVIRAHARFGQKPGALDGLRGGEF